MLLIPSRFPLLPNLDGIRGILAGLPLQNEPEKQKGLGISGNPTLFRTVRTLFMLIVSSFLLETSLFCS